MKLVVADYTQAYCLETAARKKQPERTLRRTALLADAACQIRPHNCQVAAAQLRDAEFRLAALQMEASVISRQAADVLWQDYGEQGSFWFHRLARTAQGKTQTMVVNAADGTRLSLTAADPAERDAAAERLATYYEDLFAPVPTDAAAQATILAVTPQRLGPDAVTAAEGPAGAPALTFQCFATAVAGAPRGKRPGSDGLPYEFYAAFEADVAPLVLAAFQEAFDDAHAPSPLSLSQRTGLITRIHKGGGKPLEDCDSFRPITLLNCDYKLAARIIATRLGSPVNDILTVTQTAFVPGRDIVDNVLYHLEEIDWLEAGDSLGQDAEQAQRQGCVVFLDFEKAYDRASRVWLRMCLQHFGFGVGVQRWVEVLMAGTVAHVMYNGMRTRSFNVLSGMAQGSPLSPLLYNIQAEPLAAYLQHLQASGAIRPIPLPDGSPSPATHQHADDTTLHLHCLQDAPAAMAGVQLFCQASGGRLNVAKSQGMLLGSHPDVMSADGMDDTTGVRFCREGQTIRHLGVLLAKPAHQAAAAATMHAQRLASVQTVVRQWRPFGLSHLGRVYVAKQCMASSLYYHAQFVRPDKQQLNKIVTTITRYMSQPSPGGDQDDARATISHPKMAVASLPREDGGLNVVDVRFQLDALQAKLVARLYHPHKHPWKVLMAATLTAAAPRHLGTALPLYKHAPMTRRGSRTAKRTSLSPRLADYLGAMRRMAPHRSMAAADMTHHDILLEPLFDNPNIRHPESHAVFNLTTAPTILARTLQQHNVWRLSDLRRVHLLPVPTLDITTILAMLPDSWRAAVVIIQEPAPLWLCNAASTLVASSLAFLDVDCRIRGVLADGRLSKLDVRLDPVEAAALAIQVWQPCNVVSVPRSVALMTLAERESIEEQIRSGVARDQVVTADDDYLCAAYSKMHMSPSLWALGSKCPMLAFKVRKVALRARRLRAAKEVAGYQPGRAMVPKAWTTADGSGGITGVEQRWTATLQRRDGPPVAVDANGVGPSNAGVALAARRRRQFGQWEPPGWMRDTHRFDQQQQDHHGNSEDEAMIQPAVVEVGGIGRRVRARNNQGTPQRSVGTAAPAPEAQPQNVEVGQPLIAVVGDHVDAAAAQQDAGPDLAKEVWERLDNRTLQREPRALAWRILHMSLYTGVFYSYVTGKGAAHAGCTSPQCAEGTLETMQHLFLECPDVAPVADWLCRLWGAIVGPAGTAPPCTAGVLLADDQREWEPGGGVAHGELWTALRLCFLQAAWAMRCRRAADPQRFPGSAAGLVAAVVAGVAQLIRRDYARTQGDSRHMTAAPSDWFRGTTVPMLTSGGFLERWGIGEVLCDLGIVNAAGQYGPLAIKLTAIHPVALIDVV